MTYDSSDSRASQLSCLRLLIENSLIGSIRCCIGCRWLAASKMTRSCTTCLRLELKMECCAPWPLSLLTCLCWWNQVLHLLCWGLTLAMSSSFVTYTVMRVLIGSWLLENFGVGTKWPIISSWSFSLMMYIHAWTSEVITATDILGLTTICKIIE